MTPDLPERARQAHRARFGEPATVLVQAPGRVNLIGEHTDYNGGFVLPCAIDRRVVVAASPRTDGQVLVLASDLGDEDHFPARPPIAPAPAGRRWADYVRGACLQQAAPPGGVQLTIASQVPQGAGLSSSAALTVAVLIALQALAGRPAWTPAELARRAQAVENVFVGCPCGIMDPLISAAALPGHALLIDCLELSTTAVPLPPSWAVVIADSQVPRGLVDSAYAERRAQCQAAAHLLDLASLRELTTPAWQAHQSRLPPTLLRRARHVLTENLRTGAAADALRHHDLSAMGRLMAASHASLRDDFEVTVPAIDELVALMQQTIGPAGGARMTGGGFGGCAVALLPADRADALVERIAHEYRSPQGATARVWVTHAVGGAGLLAPT